MAAAPSVSVVIPTWNGIATVPALLDALRGQSNGRDLEIVAIDSGSTDGTAEFLDRHGATVVRIPSAEFNHGTTRNHGIERSSGDLIVLMVQDAVPIGPTWLANLIAPLTADDTLAGTFAGQEPHLGASALACWSVSRWIAAGTSPRIAGPLTIAEWRELAPARRHELCAFDNVCSCVRRSVWSEHRFAHVTIAEDLEWAKAVLLDGWRIAFVPEARVRHSHDRGAWYELHRTTLLHRRLFELFGLRTIPTRGALTRSIASTLASHARVAGPDGAAAVGRALALGVAWPLGQYRGGRAAVRAESRR
jgi:rhamnosyltransferase